MFLVNFCKSQMGFKQFTLFLIKTMKGFVNIFAELYVNRYVTEKFIVKSVTYDNIYFYADV